MSRWGKTAITYKHRKVTIRVGGTDTSKLEKMLREQYLDIITAHYAELGEVAEQIESDALYLVPYDTGTLESSVMVRTSRSPGHLGIIAHVSAHDRGYDYAPIQEENEDFDHTDKEGYDQGKSAHFLGGPFALNISDYFKEVTGKNLKLPPELEHAKEYVEDNL